MKGGETRHGNECQSERFAKYRNIVLTALPVPLNKETRGAFGPFLNQDFTKPIYRDISRIMRIIKPPFIILEELNPCQALGCGFSSHLFCPPHELHDDTTPFSQIRK